MINPSLLPPAPSPCIILASVHPCKHPKVSLDPSGVEPVQQLITIQRAGQAEPSIFTIFCQQPLHLTHITSWYTINQVNNQNETDTPLTITSHLTHLTSSDEIKPLKKPDFPLTISVLYDRLNFEFIISFVRSYTSKTPGKEDKTYCRDLRISF